MRAGARQIIDGELLEIPAYALTDQELWTPKLVKDALVEAYQVLTDTTGRIGPARMRAYWPDYSVEFPDLIAQAEIGIIPKARTRRQRTTREINRMEMVLLGWRDSAGVNHPAWLNGPVVAYERPRRCLMAWVMAKHHGVTATAVCQRNEWPLATFKRHVTYGAAKIAHQLNSLEVEPWYI